MFKFTFVDYTKEVMNGLFLSFLSFCDFFSLSFDTLSIGDGSSSYPPTADGTSHVANDFLVAGCICAFASSEKSAHTVWFVKIHERQEAGQPLKGEK